MKEFFFKLFRLEYEIPHCLSCEALQMELSRVWVENDRLLNHILAAPKVEETKSVSLPQPIKSSYIPWSVRRQMLEADDRKLNEIKTKIDKESKSIEELESELRVNE